MGSDSSTAFFAFITLIHLASSVEAQSTKPLAYVRSIVVLPVHVKDTAGNARPASIGLRIPGRDDKRAEQKLTVQRELICGAAPRAVQTAVRGVLSRTAGIGTVLERETSDTTPADLVRAARDAGADAALSVVVYRCGLHAGLEREVWVRVRGEMADTGGRSTGPFFGVGRARATRKFIGKGLSRTDDELMAQAALQASSQMVREMRTGERSPFAAGGRVAIVRATVPGAIQKTRAAGGTEAVSQPVRVPSLVRQSDVLFQPELPPTMEVVETGETDSGLKAIGVDPADFWEASGRPRQDLLRRLSAQLRTDYVFLSQVREVAAEETSVEAPDGKIRRPGIERKVEVIASGALFSVALDRLLWQDTVEGGTIAKTEYVRHKPRIRTDEQAVMDAVHTAYAYLRYSFDEFHRRYFR